MIGGSILSAADLRQAFTAEPIETVVHCAVITAGSSREKADPETIVAVNVQGAVAAMLAASRAGVTTFVYPSSGSIYGSAARDVPLIDEDGPSPAPVALYGLTKRAAETILPRVAAVQGMRCAIARLGSVYGPWEDATGVRDSYRRCCRCWNARTTARRLCLGRPGAATSSIRATSLPVGAARRCGRIAPNDLQSRQWTAGKCCDVVRGRGANRAAFPLAARDARPDRKHRQPYRFSSRTDGDRQDRARYRVCAVLRLRGGGARLVDVAGGRQRGVGLTLPRRCSPTGRQTNRLCAANTLAVGVIGAGRRHNRRAAQGRPGRHVAE